MKKIFMTLSAGTTLAVAIALTSCNNAEQVKKQVDEQNAKIQTLVDEKLNGLQGQVDTECAAKVDSLANAAFTTWKEEEAKNAKKGAKKPAVKPKAKPTEPKKPETKADKMGGNTNTNNSAADKASKMGGNTNTTNTPNSKASKMGGNH